MSELLRLFEKASSVWVGVFRGSDMKIEFLNPSAVAVFGDRDDETSDQGLAAIISPTIKGKFTSRILPELRIFGEWSGQCWLLTMDGSEVEVMLHLVRETTEESGADARIGMLELPISSTEKADGRASDNDCLRALLDNLPDDISFKDLASRFIRINRSMLEQFGVESEADAMGKTDFDFCGVSHAAKAFTDEQTIIKTRAPVLDEEEHEIDSAGNTRWLTTTKMPRFDRKGDVVGIFGVSRDITSRKLEEADRQLAQKLESIGAMAAGIAHEINIPTQFITDNVKFGLDPFSELVAELPADIKERNNDMAFLLDKIPQALSQRLDGLERVGRIVSSRKQFAHPSAPESKPADLNAAIEATIQVFWHEWKYVAEMVCRLDEALPRVSCMIDQINQVVLNLVVNAAHVIEAANRETERERGRIEVRTRRLENEVMIEVEDDGSGIPASIQTRVFDPFFTTKEVRYGTGQGLAIAHKVVTEQHRGRIHFELEIGRGTTFHVRLPIAMQEGTEEV